MWSGWREIKTENEENHRLVYIDPSTILEPPTWPSARGYRLTSLRPTFITRVEECTSFHIDHGPYKGGCLLAKWYSDDSKEYYIEYKTDRGDSAKKVILRVEEGISSMTIADNVFYIYVNIENRTFLHRFNFEGEEEAVLEFDRIINEVIPVKNTLEFFLRDRDSKKYKLYDENANLLMYIHFHRNDIIKQVMSTSYSYIFLGYDAVYITNGNGALDRAFDTKYRTCRLIGVRPDDFFMIGDETDQYYVLDPFGNFSYSIEVSGQYERPEQEKIMNEYISEEEYTSTLIRTDDLTIAEYSII